MVKKSSAKLDTLLEPLLLEAGDQQADELLSRLITVHAEPSLHIADNFTPDAKKIQAGSNMAESSATSLFEV